MRLHELSSAKKWFVYFYLCRGSDRDIVYWINCCERMHEPLIVQKAVAAAAAFKMERTIIDFYLSSFSLIMCTYKVNSGFLSLSVSLSFHLLAPIICEQIWWLKRNAFLIVKIFRMQSTHIRIGLTLSGQFILIFHLRDYWMISTWNNYFVCWSRWNCIIRTAHVSLLFRSFSNSLTLLSISIILSASFSLIRVAIIHFNRKILH